jgi:hypothetical protein
MSDRTGARARTAAPPAHDVLITTRVPAGAPATIDHRPPAGGPGARGVMTP